MSRLSLIRVTCTRNVFVGARQRMGESWDFVKILQDANTNLKRMVEQGSVVFCIQIKNHVVQMHELVKQLVKQLELFDTTKIVNYDDFVLLKKDGNTFINGYRYPNPIRTRVKAPRAL